MPGHFWDLDGFGTFWNHPNLDASEHRVDPLVASWPFHTEDDDQPSTLGIMDLGKRPRGFTLFTHGQHPWPHLDQITVHQPISSLGRG